jgi:hypothetical protein
MNSLFSSLYSQGYTGSILLYPQDVDGILVVGRGLGSLEQLRTATQAFRSNIRIMYIIVNVATRLSWTSSTGDYRE